MKCLHICETVDIELGGVSRAVIDLVTGLHRSGLPVGLACRDFDSVQKFVAPWPDGPRVHDVSNVRKFGSDTRKLIQQADIVHLHTPWDLKNPGLVRTAVKLGKPVILSVHGMLDDWSMKQKSFKKWSYIRYSADRMIRNCVLHCTAKSESDQVLKRANPLYAEVVPLVIQERYFECEPDSAIALSKWPFLGNPDLKKVAFLGRVHPKKGVDVAIEAISHVKNAVLVIIGPGESEYIKGLKRLAKRIGVAERIHWLGSLYDQEKDSVLAACDCMVLPTHQENFGLVLVEGLALGLRVITSKGTDIWKELKNCGGVVVNRTPKAFAEAIENSPMSAGDRIQRQQNQRSKLREWIDPTKTIDSYVSMYERCVQSRVSGRSSVLITRPTNLILHTVGSLSLAGGGPTVSVPAICRRLTEIPKPWECQILTHSGSNEYPNVEITHNKVIEMNPSLGIVGSVRLAKQKIAEIAPRIVHDHGQWLPINHAASVAAKELGIPRIVSPRGMLSPWSRRHHAWKKKPAWWLYAKEDLFTADVLHATSQLELDELRDLGCRHPIALIPNGCYRFEVSDYEKRSPRYALFMSRIHAKKGIFELVEAWQKLNPIGWELVIAGPDRENMLDQLNLEASANIRYVGSVHGDQKLKLLSESSLFVLPSYSENFGIVIAEALMAATPVITTYGTPWEIVRERKCGWWMDMTKESLLEHLKMATDLPRETLDEMGREGRKLALERFSWIAIAESMGEVYRWMLEGGKPPECMTFVDK